MEKCVLYLEWNNKLYSSSALGNYVSSPPDNEPLEKVLLIAYYFEGLLIIFYDNNNDNESFK